MSATRFLKPAPGRNVLQDEGVNAGQPWPETGMEAEDRLFVRRRFADGDLIEAEMPDATTSTDDSTSRKSKGN